MKNCGQVKPEWDVTQQCCRCSCEQSTQTQFFYNLQQALPLYTFYCASSLSMSSSANILWYIHNTWSLTFTNSYGFVTITWVKPAHEPNNPLRGQLSKILCNDNQIHHHDSNEHLNYQQWPRERF